jgi:hypothetical protein
MVKVLPEPVTPSSTWSRSSALRPAISSLIAWGWSPAGWNSEVSPNGRLSSLGWACTAVAVGKGWLTTETMALYMPRQERRGKGGSGASC